MIITITEHGYHPDDGNYFMTSCQLSNGKAEVKWLSNSEQVAFLDAWTISKEGDTVIIELADTPQGKMDYPVFREWLICRKNENWRAIILKELEPEPVQAGEPESVHQALDNARMSWEMLAPKLGMVNKGAWLLHALRNRNSPEIWNQLGLPKGSLGRINDRADGLNGRLDNLSFYKATFEEFNLLLKIIDLVASSDMPVIDILLDWFLANPGIEKNIPKIYRDIEDRNISHLWKMLDIEIILGEFVTLSRYCKSISENQFLQEFHQMVIESGEGK